MRLQDETALGAHGVAGGVVEHHLRVPLAVAAERVGHRDGERERECKRGGTPSVCL